MKRERFIPENSIEHIVGNGELTYYTYNSHNNTVAWIAYRRKQSKPFMHRAYRNEAERQYDIDMYIREAERAYNEDMRRKFVSNPYKSGDILYASWGYDQTNIDFYKVLEVKTKSIVVVEIGKERITGSLKDMSARVIANPNTITGVPMTKRVLDADGNIRLTSYSLASKWDGNPKTETYYA